MSHTPTDTETLKELLANATKGPWERSKENEVCNQIDGEYHAICTDQFCYAPEDEQEANARLIALAPQLAADNIVLQAEVERLRSLLADNLDAMEKFGITGGGIPNALSALNT